MSCDVLCEQMMQALDGELEAAALDEHLAGCADCRAEWARLQALERLLTAVPLAAPPPGFVGRTLARVDRRRRFRRSLLGSLALAAGAAVVAFLLFSPALSTLLGYAGGLPMLARMAALSLARLADAAGTFAGSLYLTLGALALPAASLALCSFCLILVAGLLWLHLIRRLQPAQVAWLRR